MRAQPLVASRILFMDLEREISMHSTYLKILLSAALLTPWMATAQAQPSPDTASRQGEALQATERDNELVFQFGQGVESMAFSAIDGRVTVDQPMSGTRVDLAPGSMTLHVFAGRSGSEQVARSWRDAMSGDDSRMFGTTIDDARTTHPEKLNFWVAGPMQINGVELQDSMYIGQGHQLTANNWWLADRTARADRCAKDLRVKDVNGQIYCFNAQGSNTYRVRACESLL